MRFVVPPLVLPLLMLGAGGCAKQGVDAVKEMRARACAGDPAGFFSHVDRKEMIRTTQADAEKKAEASFAKLDPAAQAIEREKFHKRVSAIPAAVDDTFTAWEYDIKQGPAGELCRMSVMESSEVEGTADVHVRTLSTGDRRWRMARTGDRWLLVGVGD
jgi:hypothetical protein